MEGRSRGKKENTLTKEIPPTNESTEWVNGCLKVHKLVCCKLFEYNQELNKIFKIWNHKYGDVFKYPVSLEDAPDYDNVIKKRMDLTTLKKKLSDGVSKLF